jgi:hypothetical protein
MDEITRYETRRQWRLNLILFVIALVIKLVSLFPQWIEKWYAGEIYPRIANVLRTLTGWIPFSIGDILYGIWGIMLIIFILDLFKAIFRKRKDRPYFWFRTAKHVTTVLRIYIVFNLFWGLNYNRPSIYDQLALKEEKYGKEEVAQLTQELIAKVNTYRLQMSDSIIYPSRETIYDQVADSYNRLALKDSFFAYKHTSIKSSLYGKLGNKLGFLGYYNPFTGEAQLNTKIPGFLFPFVTCHEVAHQLGYAYENEANFVGYLAGKETKDPVFLYSTYFDLFTYANSDLFQYDSLQARNNYKLLDTLVRKDVKELRAYYKQMKNPFEPVIRMLYGEFLKINNQPKGIQTYNEVVGALLAYRRKYGSI